MKKQTNYSEQIKSPFANLLADNYTKNYKIYQLEEELKNK